MVCFMIFSTRVIPALFQLIYLMLPTNELLLCNAVISTLGLCYESTSIARKGLRDHFKSFLNVIDFSGFIAGIVWNIYMYTKEFQCSLVPAEDSEEKFFQCANFSNGQEVAGWLKLINIVWTMAINLRVTDVFYLFAGTRQLASVLGVGAYDSSSFILIVGAILYLFAIVLHYFAY